MSAEAPEPWLQPVAVARARMILASYRHWTGRRLIPALASPKAQARALFLAPLAVLAHGTQADPILDYGNALALELWELDWTGLTRLPSRLTAEAGDRRARERFLAQVAHRGYAEGYRGVRVSARGRRFEIIDATVWTLMGEDGCAAGLAACFRRWQRL